MVKRSALVVGIILGFGLISNQANAQNCDLDYGWLGCGSDASISLEGCSFTGISFISAPTEGLAKAMCRNDIDLQAGAAVNYYCEDCIHPAPNNCSPGENAPWWGLEPWTYRCSQDPVTEEWTCACSMEGNEYSYIEFWCGSCKASEEL